MMPGYAELFGHFWGTRLRFIWLVIDGIGCRRSNEFGFQGLSDLIHKASIFPIDLPPLNRYFAWAASLLGQDIL